MKKTRVVKVGNVRIGGDAPISIQSMTATLTSDAKSTICQIHKLEDEGCEIVRVSVPDIDSLSQLKRIKKNISIPLVADIHYDYKLAVGAASIVDKIRINPGNIGSEDKVKAVVKACRDNSIPIRVGVNLGSLEKDIEEHLGLTAEAMVESAMRNIAMLEKLGFYDTIVALKSSNVLKALKANKLFSAESDYPLHIGITESGSEFSGTIKSSVGIGALLSEGIGNTIRVSLSGDPVNEVRVAKKILSSLSLRKFGVEVISCPTCARANFDVANVCKEIEKEAAKAKKPLTVAIMGCSVNGPGEAKEADIGVVGGKPCLLYKCGKVVGKVEPRQILKAVMGYIDSEDQLS